MVEIFGIIFVVGGTLLLVGGIIMSYNIAKGGIDIMEFFSNAGRRGAGHTRNDISGFGAEHVKKDNPKWKLDGKMK